MTTFRRLLSCWSPSAICMITLPAAELSVVAVHSGSMGTEVATAVLVPASYAADSAKRFPVIYFLDGYDGDGKRLFSDFCKDTLPRQADDLGIIMVAVGCIDKWYFDSPRHPEVRWQTFITSELITAIDGRYRTIRKRAGRAITGLSMGGHGAFFTAFRHPDLFAAAGSTSGGVDFRPFPSQWKIAEQLGDMVQNQAVWDANVVVGNLDRLPKAGLAITFDCGTADFFLAVNRDLDQRLTRLGVPHAYAEFPGGHETSYWQKSFPRQVDFFARVFAGKPAR